MSPGDISGGARRTCIGTYLDAEKKTLCHDPLHRKALLWGQIPTARQCHGYVANEVLVGPAPERLDLYMYIYIYLFSIFLLKCV